MSLVCANCQIEIRWQPTIVDGKVFCCVGCSQGGPCTCDYEHLPQASDAPLARRMMITPAQRQVGEATPHAGDQSSVQCPD